MLGIKILKSILLVAPIIGGTGWLTKPLGLGALPVVSLVSAIAAVVAVALFWQQEEAEHDG